MPITPVILSGGSGTRLWPISRRLFPKQFVAFTNEYTMFQNTIRRLDAIAESLAPIVVCNESHRFIVAEQLRRLEKPASAIIIEPVGRNTAPAIAAAAMEAMKEGEDPVLMIMPADHVIVDANAFAEAVRIGCEPARQGRFVTFGIVAKSPHTGYGYIKKDVALKLDGQYHAGLFEVDRFVEKPDLKTAEAYVSSGQYLWNSGMFLFRASRYLEELKRLAPEIYSGSKKAWTASRLDLDFLRLDAEAFAACPSGSIDYEVLEKTTDVVVATLDAGWNDIGSWSALWEVGESDSSGNVIQGDVFVHDVTDSYIQAESRIVAVLGLKDLTIVESPDVVMVCARDRSQDVKIFVDQLRKAGRKEAEAHRRIYRPWGFYECIEQGEGYLVNRLRVDPGGMTSFQKHNNQGKHWVITHGKAKISREGQEFILIEEQAVHISAGETHQLENPGTEPLELIEILTGVNVDYE